MRITQTAQALPGHHSPPAGLMSLPVWERLRNETKGNMRIAQEASLAS